MFKIITMENTNKTTNEKANTIIDVFEAIEEVKKELDIQFINYKWDETNNKFDINLVPKQTLKYINVDFVLTPSGCTFK